METIVFAQTDREKFGNHANGFSGEITVKDPRVRTYVTPTRVVWQTGENTVINADALLSKGNGQVTLDETNVCMVEEDGGLLLDFGHELHGGIQINVGRMASKEPARFRVRFGESVSEAMSRFRRATKRDERSRDPRSSHPDALVGKRGSRKHGIPICSPRFRGQRPIDPSCRACERCR